MGNVLEIKPLSRVEGHGTVKVSIAGRQVESVQLNLIESPRLFEALLVGKPYDELPEIICRICSGNMKVDGGATRLPTSP